MREAYKQFMVQESIDASLAQLAARQSHNLKAVSSTLTIRMFFNFSAINLIMYIITTAGSKAPNFL